MKRTKVALKRAAVAVGGFPELASMLGVTRHALYQWDKVPSERVLAVEAASGVSRHDLRPDLYPREQSAGAA